MHHKEHVLLEFMTNFQATAMRMTYFLPLCSYINQIWILYFCFQSKLWHSPTLTCLPTLLFLKSQRRNSKYRPIFACRIIPCQMLTLTLTRRSTLLHHSNFGTYLQFATELNISTCIHNDCTAALTLTPKAVCALIMSMPRFLRPMWPYGRIMSSLVELLF